MKPSVNADIQKLFDKFGGDSGSYQEIHQDYAVEQAQQSWPIVNALEKGQAGAPKLKVSVAADHAPSMAQLVQSTAIDTASIPFSEQIPATIPDSTQSDTQTTQPVQVDIVMATPLNSIDLAKPVTAEQAELTRFDMPVHTDATMANEPPKSNDFSTQVTVALPDSTQSDHLTAQPAQAEPVIANNMLSSLLLSKQPPPASLAAKLSSLAQPASRLNESLTMRSVRVDVNQTNDTLNSLFGALKNKMSVRPKYVQSTENDPLNSVFLRVLGAQKPVDTADNNNLHSLLGYLNK